MISTDDGYATTRPSNEGGYCRGVFGKKDAHLNVYAAANKEANVLDILLHGIM